MCNAFFIQRGHRRSLPILRKNFFLIGGGESDGWPQNKTGVVHRYQATVVWVLLTAMNVQIFLYRHALVYMYCYHYFMSLIVMSCDSVYWMRYLFGPRWSINYYYYYSSVCKTWLDRSWMICIQWHNSYIIGNSCINIFLRLAHSWYVQCLSVEWTGDKYNHHRTGASLVYIMAFDLFGTKSLL